MFVYGCFCKAAMNLFICVTVAGVVLSQDGVKFYFRKTCLLTLSSKVLRATLKPPGTGGLILNVSLMTQPAYLNFSKDSMFRLWRSIPCSSWTQRQTRRWREAEDSSENCAHWSWQTCHFIVLESSQWLSQFITAGVETPKWKLMRHKRKLRNCRKQTN